jgi:hypothetical protein
MPSRKASLVNQESTNEEGVERKGLEASRVLFIEIREFFARANVCN